MGFWRSRSSLTPQFDFRYVGFCGNVFKIKQSSVESGSAAVCVQMFLLPPPDSDEVMISSVCSEVLQNQPVGLTVGGVCGVQLLLITDD